MKVVGIKLLKAKLSEYIRLVKAGETILVTERDQVVAELGPARRQPAPLDSVDERLRALSDRGEVTRASLSPQAWKGLASKPLAGVISQAILDALRDGDR